MLAPNVKIDKTKFTVEEKFSGAGLVYFKTSKFTQSIGWVRDYQNADGFVLMSKYHWPDHIMEGVKDSIRSYLTRT